MQFKLYYQKQQSCYILYAPPKIEKDHFEEKKSSPYITGTCYN